jgi:GDPmannose 4,6-dehydratase
MKNILIIGATSQDGSNLIRYLIKINEPIKITGTYRNIDKINNIIDIKDKINLIKFNLNDTQDIENLFINILPDYIFNFVSEQPQFQDNNIIYMNNNVLSTIAILDNINKYNKNIKYLSCGSSLEFGNISNFKNSIVDINDMCYPDSMYGLTKNMNRQIINLYRNKFNIFAVHVVLFNHDSASRSDNFISKKISKSLIKIKENIENNQSFDIIEIDNIFTYRDWSDSRDFIKAIWLMLNQNISRDYILSSSKEYSIYDYINCCLEIINFKNTEWIYDEKSCYLLYNNKVLLKSKNINIIKNIIGNNDDTKKILNWEPEITFKQMIYDIINNNF